MLKDLLEEEEEQQQNKQRNIVNTYISVITIKVNGLMLQQKDLG